MNETTFSPADLAAVMGNNENNWGGGAWWIILLFICLFGGGAWGGYGNGGAAAATAQDLQRAVDLNSIQEGQSNGVAQTQRVAYEVGGMVKDASYNNLSEIRDLQTALGTDTALLQRAVAEGFTNVATGQCATMRAIDGVKYEGAINTAAINANLDAKFAALEKQNLEQQIAAQQGQINQLQLQSAMCGVVRFPMSYSYPWPGAGPGPLYGAPGTAF